MARTKLWLSIFMFVVLNQACSEDNVLYQGTFPMTSDEWTFVNQLDGTWTQDDSLSDVNVVLGISHSTDFGYQNLYLTGELQKDNQIIWTDTFSIQLARPNSGEWLGKKEGSTVIVTDTIPYKLSLAPGQQFYYQFSQHSREEVLQGIYEVEVKVIDN